MLNRKILIYCIKLLLAYCFLYYGTQAVIGLAAPGGYYCRWIDTYFNYPALLRKALLITSKIVVNLLGYQSEIAGVYKIKFLNGSGVKIVYSCLGVGLFSFWTAFILANDTRLKRKIIFIVTGLSAIFLINVTRIVLLLIAANKGSKIPFGLGHHTIFTIAAYILIILMIFIFDRSEKKYKADQRKKEKVIEN